jgi:hypothetical protein
LAGEFKQKKSSSDSGWFGDRKFIGFFGEVQKISQKILDFFYKIGVPENTQNSIEKIQAIIYGRSLQTIFKFQFKKAVH